MVMDGLYRIHHDNNVAYLCTRSILCHGHHPLAKTLLHCTLLLPTYKAVTLFTIIFVERCLNSFFGNNHEQSLFSINTKGFTLKARLTLCGLFLPKRTSCHRKSI